MLNIEREKGERWKYSRKEKDHGASEEYFVGARRKREGA
jgi:hypothetical protein